MSVEARSRARPDSAEESSQDRRASGFTAVNGSKEITAEPRLDQETPGTNQPVTQSTYAPVVSEQHHDNWAAMRLSPTTHKRKRSTSVDESPKSRMANKRASSVERRNTYPGQASESVEGTRQHFADQETQVHSEAPAGEHYAGVGETVWSHQADHHSTNLNDDQLAEVLQRETQLDSHAHTLGSLEASPEERYSMDPAEQQQQQVEGTAPNTPGLESANLQKQRKRNFSNRTKTGCLTCRERKKKCDEAKPTCNNCDRGGFYCKGYSQQLPSYKPPAAMYRDPPVLHAKNGYVESQAAYSYPPRQMSGEYYAEAQQALVSNTAVPEEVREQQMRQVSSPQGSVRSVARSPWPENATLPGAQAQQAQYPPEVLPRPEYSQISRVPDLARELSRDQKKLPPPASTMNPPHHRSGSQPPQYNDQRITAQLALQQTPSRPAPSQSPVRAPAVPVGPLVAIYTTEKEKMLHGQPYLHLDPDLKTERTACFTAVQAFNRTALDPASLPADRVAHLRQIMHSSSSSTLPTPTGHIGERVEVAGPFVCDYGYNIHLADDVEISAGCTVLDACPVSIGARTFIGPDVSIYTAEGDQYKVPGQKRACVAKAVVIEDDCWIGGRVVILPGVVVGKGSTVGAGTVVARDVPAFTTVCAENNLRVVSSAAVWEQQSQQPPR